MSHSNNSIENYAPGGVVTISGILSVDLYRKAKESLFGLLSIPSIPEYILPTDTAERNRFNTQKSYAQSLTTRNKYRTISINGRVYADTLDTGGQTTTYKRLYNDSIGIHSVNPSWVVNERPSWWIHVFHICSIIKEVTSVTPGTNNVLSMPVRTTTVDSERFGKWVDANKTKSTVSSIDASILSEFMSSTSSINDLIISSDTTHTGISGITGDVGYIDAFVTPEEEIMIIELLNNTYKGPREVITYPESALDRDNLAFSPLSVYSSAFPLLNTYLTTQSNLKLLELVVFTPVFITDSTTELVEKTEINKFEELDINTATSEEFVNIVDNLYHSLVYNNTVCHMYQLATNRINFFRNVNDASYLPPNPICSTMTLKLEGGKYVEDLSSQKTIYAFENYKTESERRQIQGRCIYVGNKEIIGSKKYTVREFCDYMGGCRRGSWVDTSGMFPSLLKFRSQPGMYKAPMGKKINETGYQVKMLYMGNKVYYLDKRNSTILAMDDLGDKVIIDYKPASETAYLDPPTKIDVNVFGFKYTLSPEVTQRKLLESPITKKLNDTSTDNPTWIYGLDSLQTTYMSPTPLEESSDGTDVVWPSKPKIIPYSRFNPVTTDKIEKIQPMLMEENEKGYLKNLYKCFTDAIVVRMLGDWYEIPANYKGTFVSTVTGVTEATLRDVKTLEQFKNTYSEEWFQTNILIFSQLFWGAWNGLSAEYEARYFEGGLYSWDLLGIWQPNLMKKSWEIISPIRTPYQTNLEYGRRHVLQPYETEGGEASLLARFLNTSTDTDFQVLVIAPVNKMIDEPICSCVFGNDRIDYKIPVRNNDGTINVSSSYKTENINNFNHVTSPATNDANNYYKNGANINRPVSQFIHPAFDANRGRPSTQVQFDIEELFTPATGFINHDLTVNEISVLTGIIRKSSLIPAHKNIDVWNMDVSSSTPGLYLNDIQEIPVEPLFVKTNIEWVDYNLSTNTIETMMLVDDESSSCTNLQIGAMKGIVEYSQTKNMSEIFEDKDVHTSSALSKFVAMTSTAKIILPMVPRHVRADLGLWKRMGLPEANFSKSGKRFYVQPTPASMEIINKASMEINSRFNMDDMLYKYYFMNDGIHIDEEVLLDEKRLIDIVKSFFIEPGTVNPPEFRKIVENAAPWILPLLVAQRASQRWGDNRNISSNPPIWKPDQVWSTEADYAAEFKRLGWGLQNWSRSAMRSYAETIIDAKVFSYVKTAANKDVFKRAYVNAISTMKNWEVSVKDNKTAGQLSDATQIGLLGVEVSCVDNVIRMSNTDYALGAAKIAAESMCSLPFGGLYAVCTLQGADGLTEAVNSYYDDIINDGKIVTTCKRISNTTGN